MSGDIVVTTDGASSPTEVSDLALRGDRVVVLAALPNAVAEASYRHAGARAYLAMVAAVETTRGIGLGAPGPSSRRLTAPGSGRGLLPNRRPPRQAHPVPSRPRPHIICTHKEWLMVAVPNAASSPRNVAQAIGLPFALALPDPPSADPRPGRSLLSSAPRVQPVSPTGGVPSYTLRGVARRCSLMGTIK